MMKTIEQAIDECFIDTPYSGNGNIREIDTYKLQAILKFLLREIERLKNEPT